MKRGICIRPVNNIFTSSCRYATLGSRWWWRWVGYHEISPTPNQLTSLRRKQKKKNGFKGGSRKGCVRSCTPPLLLNNGDSACNTVLGANVNVCRQNAHIIPTVDLANEEASRTGPPRNLPNKASACFTTPNTIKTILPRGCGGAKKAPRTAQKPNYLPT